MTVTSNKAVQTRPRDASMSLLNNVFADSLDPGYRSAAARRRRESSEAASGRSKPRVSAALMVGMLALGLLFSVAILQAQGSESVLSAEREGLIERIRSEEDRAATLRDTRTELQAEIAQLEDRQLSSSAEGQQVREELQLLQNAAGTGAVSGPGASVVLDNAEDPEAMEDPNLARVLDFDLQQVVNGLWAAGAEAISINGERITAMSPIRMASDVIHVNSRPLSPPYHVQAIGDSRTLPSEFSEGIGGEFLRTASPSGIRYTIRAEESVTLPAADLGLRYATRSEEGS